MTDQTIIIIPDDEDLEAAIRTSRRKWINRMEALEKEGLAEEVETEVEGAREWELEQAEVTITLPFRKPRTYTKAQKEAARKRLAKVRAEVQAAKEDEPEEEPVEDLDDLDDEDFEVEMEDEPEEEEVVVKKKKRRRKKK